jgi:hypothetical protein
MSARGTSARRVRHPKRVQARRAGVTNYRLVTRATRWGNPFPVPPHTREQSLAKYAAWLRTKLADEPDFLEPLRGYDLGCTCAPELPCHVDVILRELYGPRGRPASARRRGAARR